ncbi:MAG: hypothetical protein ABIT38_21280 [Gemmatimonadaceae bacterium]
MNYLLLHARTRFPRLTDASNDPTRLARRQGQYSRPRRVGALAFGDLFLADVRQFREALGRLAGYASEPPLWGRDTTRLAAEFVAAGYEAYVTGIDTTQLYADFAGRRFDSALLAKLPASVDPRGERGEFHTCVGAGPTFRSPIPVECGKRVLRENRFAYCDLIPVALSTPNGTTRR